MKVHILKWLVFLALMGGFYAFDGFDCPVAAPGSYRGTGRMDRAWIATVLLYVCGAVMTLWGNSLAQHVDWDIPEGLYPLLGVLLLIAGFVWMLMVRDAARL